MRRWLARLSFSFFLIACVLAWEAHKTTATRQWRTMYTLGAAACVAMGVLGVRERHRQDPP